MSFYREHHGRLDDDLLDQTYKALNGVHERARDPKESRQLRELWEKILQNPEIHRTDDRFTGFTLVEERTADQRHDPASPRYPGSIASQKDPRTPAKPRKPRRAPKRPARKAKTRRRR